MNSRSGTYDHVATDIFRAHHEGLKEKPKRIVDKHIGMLLYNPYRKTTKLKNYKPGDFQWKLREDSVNLDRKPYRITFRICEECRRDGAHKYVKCDGCATRDSRTIVFFTIENKFKLQSKRFRR